MEFECISKGFIFEYEEWTDHLLHNFQVVLVQESGAIQDQRSFFILGPDY